MLDLEVLPAQIFQLAAAVVADHVAGPVDHLGPAVLQRILHKALRRLLRAVEIPEGHGAASGAEFSLLCGGAVGRGKDQVVLLIQHQDIRIIHRISDGEGLVVGKLPIQIVIGADIGLRRPVHIGVQGIRQIPSPVIQLLDRHHLARKEDIAQVFRLFCLEGIQVGRHAEGKGYPEDGRHLILIQKHNQLHREGEILRRHDHHAAAELQHAVDVVIRHIKIEGHLVGQHLVGGEMILPLQPLHVVQNHPVGHQHALRHAGGTAGKQHIQRIVICAPLPDGTKNSFIDRKLDRFLIGDRPCFVRSSGHKTLRPLPVCFPDQHRGGAQHRKNGADPLLRHGDVYGTVKAACVDCPHKSRDHIGRLVHEHRHSLPL